MASNKKFATWAVSLTNFLDSSCIVAGASGLTLWTSALKLDNFQVGLLGALSANAFGSAIGALIGGHLSDKYGRKVIYTKNKPLFEGFIFLIELGVEKLI